MSEKPDHDRARHDAEHVMMGPVTAEMENLARAYLDFHPLFDDLLTGYLHRAEKAEAEGLVLRSRIEALESALDEARCEAVVWREHAMEYGDAKLPDDAEWEELPWATSQARDLPTSAPLTDADLDRVDREADECRAEVTEGTATLDTYPEDEARTYEQGLRDGEDRERARIMALARSTGRELAENGKALYEKHGDYLEGRIREHVGGAFEDDLAGMLWMEAGQADFNAKCLKLANKIRAAGADTPEMRELQQRLRESTRWREEETP